MFFILLLSFENGIIVNKFHTTLFKFLDIIMVPPKYGVIN